MTYQSQFPAIWDRLQREGSSRRTVTSRSEFESVCSAFYQAENCPYSQPATRSMKQYLAEANVWAYYFGEDTIFPAPKPWHHPSREMAQASELFSPSSQYQSLEVDAACFHEVAVAAPYLAFDFTHPSESDATISHGLGTSMSMKARLEAIWTTGKNKPPDYQPQFGWNPVTQEPWLAVRSFRRNSYTALSGPNHLYLKNLLSSFPAITLQYERFAYLGFTLIWFDFTQPRDINNTLAWRELSHLRAFIEDWANDMRESFPIDQVYREYLKRHAPHRPSAPVPDTFELDCGRVTAMHAPRGYGPRRQPRRGACRDTYRPGKRGSTRPRTRSSRPSAGSILSHSHGATCSPDK